MTDVAERSDRLRFARAVLEQRQEEKVSALAAYDAARVPADDTRKAYDEAMDAWLAAAQDWSAAIHEGDVL